MTTIRRPPAPTEEFRQFAAEVARALEPLAQQVEDKKAEASWRLGSSELAGPWQRAQQRGVDADQALYDLLAQVDPWRSSQLVNATAELRQVASVVHSFDALCESLDQAQRLPAEEKIDRTRAREQYGERAKLQERITRVREALAAAGTCPAVGKFPRAQLERLDDRLLIDTRLLLEERDGLKRAPALALRAADVADVPSAARAIGRLLRDDAVAAALIAASKKVEGPKAAELARNLGALAMLTDEAVHAPDYAAVGKGWFHPRARSAYRLRQHDGWTLLASEGRQIASAERLQAGLTELTKAPDLAAAAERLLISSFLQEIGVSADRAAKYAPTAKAVREALAGEAFLPLRALNETMSSMTKGNAALEPHVRRAVDDVTRHIVEGDYTAWRYDNPRSRHQLGGLSPAQEKAWRASAGVETTFADGTKVKTREADGNELLWLTKIGGPSHGFDYGGECLLPLLSNGRTKAIVVDDPRWAHNGAARAYVRLLHFDNGTPTLYLEPLQRDFPHREAFPAGAEWGDAQRAILRHALAKADELGLTLSVSPDLEPMLRELGKGFEHHYQHRYVLRASNGVFEASDTLSHKHDWPQLADETTEGLDRLLYVPKK